MKQFLLIFSLLLAFGSQAQDMKISKYNLTKSKRTFWDYKRTQVLARGKYYKDSTCKTDECATTDEHGKWEYYTRKGEIEEVRNYYKGMLYGKVTQYYDNGAKKQEGFFKWDRQDSIYTEWYENGEIKVKGEYDMDRPAGRWEYYYRDGHIKSIEEVKGEDNYLWEYYYPDSLHTQGVKDGNGEMADYYTTGNTKEYYQYRDGLKHGEFIEYSIYGYPTLKGNFKDGDKDGKWEFFYYTGDLEKISHYEGGVLNGNYQYFYDNGQVNVEGKYVNGLKEGKWTWYTNKGDRDMQGPFQEGEQHGDWVFWYPTGEVSYYAEFDMGDRVGEWTYYYKNGQEFKKGTFAEDMKNGTWRTWYEDGTLLMEGDYADGKESGEWKNYWESGDLKNRATFANGELHGDWNSYYTNGKSLVEGEYKDNLKVGEWREYFENGRLKNVTTYKLFKKKNKFNDQILSKRVTMESKEHGPASSYSQKDYKLTEQGEYKEGEKAGEWIAYYPGGRIPAVVSNYKSGQLHGPMKQYSRRGKLLQEMDYKDGLKHGKFVIYDKRGKVLETRDYAYGQRVIEGQTNTPGSFTPGR